MESITLFYNDLATGGTSDKEYRLHIVKQGKSYVVNYENGRRGGTMQGGTKTAFPITLEEATAVFHREAAKKMKEGYVPAKTNAPASIQLVAPNSNPTRTPYPIVDMDEVKTEQEADALLNSPKFWLQKKEDGDFCQIQKKRNGTYARFNKLGNPVEGLPSEVMSDLKQLMAKTFFLEGELVGNSFIAWQVLELDGEDFTLANYATRLTALEKMVIIGQCGKLKYVTVIATWKKAEKAEGMRALIKIRAEGLVFKKFGSTGGHIKFKFTKTLSAVVLDKGRDGHNNAVLGLLNDEWGGEKYIEIGSCSLNGKEHVEIGSIIEVRYLYASAGKRLVQPRMIGVRTDVDPKKCTTKQLIYKEGVNAA